MEGTKKTSSSPPSSNSKKKTSNDTTISETPQSRPRHPANMEPLYYIGGGNGNAIIEEVMNGLGWKRIRDKTDDSFKLRWCELKTSINYNALREDQIVNHIPNCNLLTNKLGLLNSLQEYSRVCTAVQKKSQKLDFIPETYRLDDQKDRDAFVEQYKENEIWICKPTGRNQGKGIFLVRSLDELNEAVKDTDEENQQNQQQGKPTKPLNRIIQRYIINPLLIEGRKFDIRCYMLIANTVPYVVLYHKGYLRLSIYEYDNNTDNIIAHLTNQFIQKKDPRYVEEKEETAWSMSRFNDYINEKVAPNMGLEQDWVETTLPSTIKQIMTHCIHAVRHKLQCKVGYFDLYGFDFMIDEDMKIWLIEVNINPCLATNCEALREIVPGVVRETLHLSIECFEKARRGRPVLPLQSLNEFELIYTGTGGSSSKVGSGAGQNSRSAIVSPSRGGGAKGQQSTGKQSPVRRVRSLSPVKEPSYTNGDTKKKKVPTATLR